MNDNQKITEYFKTSNLIEGVEDANETLFASEFQDAKCDEETLLTYHKQMGHLNDYCKAGEYRTYPVYVGDQEGIHYSKIQSEINYLFGTWEIDFDKDMSFKYIKQWHINFENIHPFGDGNGRTGRLLMWLQCRDAGLLDELYFWFNTEPFKEMRQEYYQWFK